jgi:hypothetical protein
VVNPASSFDDLDVVIQTKAIYPSDWIIADEPIQIPPSPFGDGVSVWPAARARVVERLRLTCQQYAEQEQGQHHQLSRFHNVTLFIPHSLTKQSAIHSAKVVRQARVADSLRRGLSAARFFHTFGGTPGGFGADDWFTCA